VGLCTWTFFCLSGAPAHIEELADTCSPTKGLLLVVLLVLALKQ
jgi:hypothetical protein